MYEEAPQSKKEIKEAKKQAKAQAEAVNEVKQQEVQPSPLLDMDDLLGMGSGQPQQQQ